MLFSIQFELNFSLNPRQKLRYKKIHAQHYTPANWIKVYSPTHATNAQYNLNLSFIKIKYKVYPFLFAFMEFLPFSLPVLPAPSRT